MTKGFQTRVPSFIAWMNGGNSWHVASGTCRIRATMLYRAATAPGIGYGLMLLLFGCLSNNGGMALEDKVNMLIPAYASSLAFASNMLTKV